jgi:hypothetical protein
MAAAGINRSGRRFFSGLRLDFASQNESASHVLLAWNFSCNGRVASHMRVTQTFEDSQTMFTAARSSIRRKDWNFA